MLISDYVRRVSADFTLERSGNQVTAKLFYLLNNFDEFEYYSGDMSADIGGYHGHVHEEYERPMNLEFVATLAEATPTSGMYGIADYNDDYGFDHEFTVTLFSSAGNFVGTANADFVFGSALADTFRSAGGGDIFEGGAGNDLYRIYSADTKLIEGAGQGTNDRIASGVSYVLASGVQVEQMTTNGSTGTAKINLTGNALAQTITGNDGDNVLRDGGGAGDVLRGLGGNDTYQVYSAATKIEEIAVGGTADRVAAGVSYVLGAAIEIEWLTTTNGQSTRVLNLTGNEFGQKIHGNAGANKLDGAGGDDQLHGGDGMDVLTGGAGSDTFFIETARNAATNVETITDFTPGADEIHIQNAVFTGMPTSSQLSAAAFAANTTGLAQDADDRIIYETYTGKLFHDPDGLGGVAGVQFAMLVGAPAITNTDFAVI